jgi:PAS domain S-box-containing protein
MTEKSGRSQALRRQAEEILRITGADVAAMQSKDIQALVYELQVYQAELEVQNEELRRAHLELEHSRDAFSDLYNFSPIAYVSLSKTGVILEANLTFATLLTIERQTLIGQNISKYIDRSSQDDWFKHCQAVFGGTEKQITELTLVPMKGSARVVRLESRRVLTEHDDLAKCFTALIDLTTEKETSRQVATLSQNLINAGNEVRDLLEAAPDALLVTDSAGILHRLNKQTGRMFGYTIDELIGKPIELLIPERFHEAYAIYRKSPSLKGYRSPLLIHAVHRNGSEFPIEVTLSPLNRLDGQQHIISAIRNISERKAYEEQLQRSLQEKEVLIKEVHHRVKNNLQIVSSILKLQSNSVTDLKTKELFDESRYRIHSMALLHERLYRSEDLAHISLKIYLEDLVHDIFQACGLHTQDIEVHLDIEDVILDLDQMVDCGLITNELVSNALKHAFHDIEKGRIDIKFHRKGANFILAIGDNGPGFSQTANLSSVQTLGLTLVYGLAKELGGSAQVSFKHGTLFTITFPQQHTSHAANTTP